MSPVVGTRRTRWNHTCIPPTHYVGQTEGLVWECGFCGRWWRCDRRASGSYTWRPLSRFARWWTRRHMEPAE